MSLTRKCDRSHRGLGNRAEGWKVRRCELGPQLCPAAASWTGRGSARHPHLGPHRPLPQTPPGHGFPGPPSARGPRLDLPRSHPCDIWKAKEQRPLSGGSWRQPQGQRGALQPLPGRHLPSPAHRGRLPGGAAPLPGEFSRTVHSGICRLTFSRDFLTFTHPPPFQQLLRC